jgi:HAD superfamily hydrolase (TIGR01509 family)
MIEVRTVRAVIFDWDGTLADTKKAVIQSFQEILGEFGCRVSNEFIEKRMGIGTKNTIQEAFEECNLRCDDETLESLTKEKIRIQIGLTKIVSLFEGATELLQELQGRIMMGLATMSSRKVIDRLVLEKRIEEYFNVVVTADEIVKSKPDPEIFLVSAWKLGVNPEDCVVVEDSVFGVKAAKVAKMRCIAVSSGAYNREELGKEKPDIIVDARAEKEKIMGFIFGSI